MNPNVNLYGCVLFGYDITSPLDNTDICCTSILRRIDFLDALSTFSPPRQFYYRLTSSTMFFFFFCPDTNGIGLCLPIVTKRNKTEGIAIKAPFQSLRKKKSTKKFYICLFYFYKGGFLCILNHIYMCNYSVAKVLINTLLLPKKNFIKQRILLFFLYNLKFYSLTALYLMHYSTL